MKTRRVGLPSEHPWAGCSALALAFIFAAACSVDVDERHEGFPCEADGGCIPGMRCVEGHCMLDPCAEVECDQNQVCIEGDCIELCSGLTPSAKVGEELRVDPGAEVLLDGSLSTSFSFGDLEYAWTQLEGPSVTLSGQSTAVASFIAPAPASTLLFALEVTDACGARSEPAEIPVDVRALPPVADAGSDQIVAERDLVELDGWASFDPNEGSLTYQWSQVRQDFDPEVFLVGATTPTPTFTAPRVVTDTDLTLRLDVRDEGGLNAHDTVRIRVEKTIVSLAVVTSPPPEIGVTEAFSVVVEVRGADGVRANAARDLVTISLLGAAPEQLDGELQQNAFDGVAVFDGLSIDTLGDGLSIRAASPLLQETTTAEFQVVAGPPVGLIFASAPVDPVPVGEPFSVVVDAIDTFGNLAGSFDGAVQLGIQRPPSPPGGLHGEVEAQAVMGRVLFSDLLIDSSGPGFRLMAEADDLRLGHGASEPFDVTPFNGGSGTLEDPYQLTNVYQLQLIGMSPFSHFVIDADIDASVTSAWNDGRGFAPIAIFSGVLDGGGHVVSNLFIDRPTSMNVGMMGDMSGGSQVRNLCLRDADVSGHREVGILAGRTLPGALVERVCTTGLVRALDRYAGGLIGRSEGDVFDSYSLADFTADDMPGGLIGYHRAGRVVRCYAAGQNLSPPWSDAGGLIGRRALTHDVQDSFWDTQASGLSISQGGTGKTTAEMKNVRTYTDVAWSADLTNPWDFVGDPYDDAGTNDFWEIDQGIEDGYPFFAIFTDP